MKRRQVLLAVVSTLSFGAGLAGCVFFVLNDVQYVPGYGYVVSVKESAAPGWLPTSRDYFYVFDNEQEARKFVEDVRRDPKNPRSGRRVGAQENSAEYQYISSRVQPVPAIPVVTIDRVVPPIPTGPAPQ